MRKFLILFCILTAFSAEARQEPVYKRYEIKYDQAPATDAAVAPKPENRPNVGSPVQNRPDKTVQQPRAGETHAPKKAENTVKQHEPAKPVPHDMHRKAEPKPYVEHGAPQDMHQKAEPKPYVEHRAPHNNEKHKSGVYLNVNIHSPQPVPVADRVVVTNPVTVVRPVVYDNNIYAQGAYSCSERSGVKYCRDYRGRKLDGRIVQNYGNTVAYENYRNGYQHGETTVFSQEGLLLRKTNYKKGLKDGKEYVYYSNSSVTGKPEYVAEYKKGALHGKVEQYNRYGKRSGQMTYHKGYLQTRRCTGVVEDPIVLARIREKNYNELILCPED